jgi:uncharacterized protein (DUF2141 family)
MYQVFSIIRRISLGLLLTTFAAAGSAAELRLEISGLAGQQGKVYYSVYDSEDTWLGDERVAGAAVDIASAKEGELVIATVALPPGEYAISIFYDANSNGELDTNFIGIPKEPVALSNNAKAKFGPPKYKDALFTLTEDGGVQAIAITEI